MNEFKQFAKTVNNQFNKMVKEDVFVVNVTKEELWDTYMAAFPEGTNEIYIENPKHDCNCCKQFIRNIGGIVTIDANGNLISVWDIQVDSFYQEIANAMAKLIKSRTIMNAFKRSERKYGVESNVQITEEGNSITWNHFHCDIPSNYLSATPSADIADLTARAGVLKRGLNELTLDSLETVTDLIADDLIYKGAEKKKTVAGFMKMYKAYHAEGANTDHFHWVNAKSPYAKFKSDVIGTLVSALSEGTPLEDAVKSYEDKVSGTNYKRSSKLITPSMVKNATEKIDKLGIEPSLHRRLAVESDVSVDNVIYADSTTQSHMKGGIADLLAPAVKKSKPSTKNVTDISIEDFKSKVLAKGITSLEMQLSNTHKNNLMTLVAPTDPDAPSIFKWNNNFTWSYNGNITDSLMKEHVKSLGGKVDGQLRGSIQWNEEKSDNQNDLDIHCKSPVTHIFYGNDRGICGGNLDVDIQTPGTDSRTTNGVAVENITWAQDIKLPNGEYKFYVHNYSGRNTGGFRAEIEVGGIIYSFSYDKPVTQDVVFATITHRDGKFTIKSDLESKQSSQNVYGIPTEEFHKVSMVMLSPNFWDGQEIGNKHHFFILDGCTADEPTNGFYNEFLSAELHPHRKVFEVLSSKMRCAVAESSLSGLGFSSTKRDSVLVKADGRMYNILF